MPRTIFIFIMNMNNKRGFTFIETMVVVAVLSVIAMALGSVVNNGISIWNRVNNINFEEDVLIFFDKLTLDVRNTINFSSIVSRGDDGSISFPSIILKDGKEIPGLVIYYFDEKKKTINRKGIDFINLVNEEDAEEKVMLDKVVSAGFSYYLYDSGFGTYDWAEEYKEDLPKAIRLELTLEKGKKALKYIKTVDIPVAKLEFKKEK